MRPAPAAVRVGGIRLVTNPNTNPGEVNEAIRPLLHTQQTWKRIVHLTGALTVVLIVLMVSTTRLLLPALALNVAVVVFGTRVGFDLRSRLHHLVAAAQRAGVVLPVTEPGSAWLLDVLAAGHAHDPDWLQRYLWDTTQDGLRMFPPDGPTRGPEPEDATWTSRANR